MDDELQQKEILMTTLTRLAHLAALTSGLSVLAAGSVTADQRIFDAFENNDTGPAVAWIEAGGDPAIRDKDGMTLMHWGAWKWEIEIVQMLLDRGVDADIAAPNGTTPLMQASSSAGVAMVDLLLENGADVNAATDVNITALLFAVGQNASPKVLDRLLQAGAEPLAAVNEPGAWDHGFLPLDAVRKRNPWVLDTEPGRRLQRLTYEGTGCEGVIVLASDSPLSALAERTLGEASRWKQIAKLNGLGADKSYRQGDCLKLPVR